MSTADASSSTPSITTPSSVPLSAGAPGMPHTQPPALHSPGASPPLPPAEMQANTPAARKSGMEKLVMFMVTHKALSVSIAVMALGLACLAVVTAGGGGLAIGVLGALLLSLGFVAYSLSPQLELVINEIITGWFADPAAPLRHSPEVSRAAGPVVEGHLRALDHTSSSSSSPPLLSPPPGPSSSSSSSLSSST